MRKLAVESKTGFFSDSVVHILDENKRLFYFHPNKEKCLHFNLPEGKYFIKSDSQLRKLPVPVKYPELELSFTYEKIPLINKVFEKRNPNKATIYVGKKQIDIDSSIVNHWFKPAFVFVVFHELGHNFSKSEIECDKFSFNNMLELGYNPIQCEAARHMLLKQNKQRCKEFHFSLIGKKFRK
jgi:hypothetical protein